MTQQPNNGGNPNWKPLLDKIPQEYHHLLTPELQKWDQAVNAKFQEIHGQYEAYKGFKTLVDNGIDPQYAANAVILADQFQNDPMKVIKQANEAWNLGVLTKDEAEALRQQAAGASTASQDPFDLGENSDLMNDPRVKALAESVEEMRKQFTETKEQQEQREAAERWEDYLDSLEDHCEENNLPFHRDFVSAMLAQGMNGEQAVQQYHSVLGEQVVANYQAQHANGQQQNNQQEAPPIMGAGGTVGAGVGDGTVDFTSMGKTDLNTSIEQMLAAAQQSGQG